MIYNKVQTPLFKMIEHLQFGHTEHNSSRIIFGGYALSNGTQQDASQALSLLQHYSINHIDTAPMYGKSEELIGEWMKDFRDEFFLATKTRSRSYDGAIKNLHRSLDRLNTDYIDLWQMHGLTNPQGWKKAMGPEGTLKAFIKAKEEGLVRYLGITGHGSKVPLMHLQSLEKFDFDAVMLPYQFPMMQNPKYSKPFAELIELCKERNIAVQTIKSVARRTWVGLDKTHNTVFYQPLEHQKDIDWAVHWALGLNSSFVVTAGDMKTLPKILSAADRYIKPPSDEKMEKMIKELDMDPIFSY